MRSAAAGGESRCAAAALPPPDLRCGDAMPPAPDLPPETLARLRARYESAEHRLAEIAREEGLETRDLLALRLLHGWRPRGGRKAAPGPAHKVVRKSAGAGKKPAPRRRTAPPTKSAAPAAAAKRRPPRPPPRLGLSTAEMIVRIRALLKQALASAQARVGEDRPDETARFSNTLGRSLATLRELEKDFGTHDAGRARDEPPLDLAELRRELARRIDLLREDREAS